MRTWLPHKKALPKPGSRRKKGGKPPTPEPYYWQKNGAMYHEKKPAHHGVCVQGDAAALGVV